MSNHHASWHYTNVDEKDIRLIWKFIENNVIFELLIND